MSADASASGGQVAWVFDLNKCMGCPTCTTACHDLWTNDPDTKDQWWCTVETKPSEGHPKGWESMGGGYDGDGNLVLGERPTDGTTHDQVEYTWDPDELTEGENPTLEPDERPDWTFNWEEDEGAGEHPNSWHFYLPKICMQCSKPSCVEACPEDAIVKRDEDGVVVIDEYACDGNRYCQRACPYKVIWFNEERDAADKADASFAADGGVGGDRSGADGTGAWEVEPDGGAAETATDESGAGETPAGDRGISQMCHGCIPRLEDGVAPACARTCPARAVHFGRLDDPENSVYKLVEEWEVALPLRPQANTSPNVYYVPPLSAPKLDGEGRFTAEDRIPTDYLETLFGDGVADALATIQRERRRVENGEDSELIDTLVGYEWPEDFFGSYTTHPDENLGGDAA